MFEILLGLVLFAIIFTLSFVAVRLDKEKHGHLSILLLMTSLFFMLNGLSFSALLASNDPDYNTTIANTLSEAIYNTSYSPFIFFIIFVLGYFVIFFINNILESSRKAREEKEKAGDV